MAAIQDLLIRIDATTELLRRELSLADQSVNKTAANITAKVGVIDEQFTSLGESASGLAPALAGTDVGAGLVADLQKIGDTAKATFDEIPDEAGIKIDTAPMKESLAEVADTAKATFDEMPDEAQQAFSMIAEAATTDIPALSVDTTQAEADLA